MFDFHQNKTRYFDIQRFVTEETIIPFIDKLSPAVKKQRYVLEVGCGEAGVLKAFLDQGNKVVGVELSPSRYALACQFLSDEIKLGSAAIYNKNIFDFSPHETFGGLFDVIILKDVIEHIPDQNLFIPQLKEFLKEDGMIFFAYPPWWMPFGGHQQICTNKWLRGLPWFHLLPSGIYRWVLQKAGEKKASIHELMAVKSTGINIDRMYKILQSNDFKILGEVYWFINPIYFYKFGLKKRKVLAPFNKIPYLRNLFTTAHYIAFTK